MSVDRSLKNSNALTRHRNVLTRAERLEILEEEERWSTEKDSIFGLPKVTNRKSTTGKKKKKEVKTEETVELTEGDQEIPEAK